MTLVRLESGKSQNNFYLRYIELYDKIPQALKWLLEQKGNYLHDDKRARIASLVENYS